MSNNWKIVITTASVLAAFGGGSALHAQTTAPSHPRTGGMMQGQQGGMMEGQQGGMVQGQGGMMNMMAQMNQMMQTCNKMMQEMDMGQRSGTEKQPKER